MLTRLSGPLYRISSVWTGLLITLLYGWFIATVMPEQSAQSAAYAGDWGAPDRHLFYTPAELYAAVAGWGAAGREDYIAFRLGADIIWALAYSGFLIAWTSCALRYATAATSRLRLLNTLPLLTLLSDYLENALGILLIGGYPERMDLLAWTAAATTALKWLSLGAAHLVLLFALALAVRTRWQR